MTVAVIGLGSIGLRHARNALTLGETVAGYDPEPARGELLAALGGRVADTRTTALVGAKAAVIASPNACHRDDLAAAIEAGCCVLVEKPMTHTADGVEALLRRADERGLSVCVAHNLRLHPVVKAARTILARGELGEVLWCRMVAASYLPDWRPGQDYRAGFTNDPRTGGAIFDFVHEFDLAAHLLGPFTTTAAVARSTGALEIEAEDCADAILRHHSGVLTSLHVDYVTRPTLRVTEICGREGLLRLDLAERRLFHLTIAGEVATDRRFKSSFDDDYLNEMRVFLDGGADGHGALCSGRQALGVLRELLNARAMAGLPQA